MECHSPQPTPEHRKLARLAGTWKGTENMQPSQWCPEGMKADGVTRSRVALGGFCVVSDYEQSMAGKVTYSGHGVYTIDPESKEVVLHWFDSMAGMREEFRGSVAFVGTRDFYRPKELSPSGQGYHWNSNAETYYLIGAGMGAAMLELLGVER